MVATGHVDVLLVPIGNGLGHLPLPLDDKGSGVLGLAGQRHDNLLGCMVERKTMRNGG
jgi:hypothetical protein